jgi:hypothetical protein
VRADFRVLTDVVRSNWYARFIRFARTRTADESFRGFVPASRGAKMARLLEEFRLPPIRGLGPAAGSIVVPSMLFHSNSTAVLRSSAERSR